MNINTANDETKDLIKFLPTNLFSEIGEKNSSIKKTNMDFFNQENTEKVRIKHNNISFFSFIVFHK